MRSVVKVSKTIDDAVEEALIELDVDKNNIEIEVLEEPSRGLLGFIGAKDAVVKVSVVNDPFQLADEFMSRILFEMGLSGITDIKKEKDILFVDIKGVNPKEMGIVIGRRGSTLDAIQYLLSLVVNKDMDNYLRVVLDINEYRKKREATLERLAYKMAKKAQKNKRVVKLEPMNPYERRIIHAALQNVDYITTHSEGDEPYRRVVIKLK